MDKKKVEAFNKKKVEAFNNLIAVITEETERNLPTNENLISVTLDAYNRYQEAERDGVDYIFNLNNADNLKSCVEGGLTAYEIAEMVKNINEKAYTPYFFFGVNHKSPKQIKEFKELTDQLIANVEEVVRKALAYPFNDGYKQFYIYTCSYVLD